MSATVRCAVRCSFKGLNRIFALVDGQDNNTLKQLVLDRNSIGLDGIKTLALTLKVCCNRTHSHSPVGFEVLMCDHCLALCMWQMNYTLHTISLAGNHMSAHAAMALADALKESRTLLCVDVRCGRDRPPHALGDRELRAFISALNTNRSVTELYGVGLWRDPDSAPAPFVLNLPAAASTAALTPTTSTAPPAFSFLSPNSKGADGTTSATSTPRAHSHSHTHHNSASPTLAPLTPSASAAAGAGSSPHVTRTLTGREVFYVPPEITNALRRNRLLRKEELKEQRRAALAATSAAASAASAATAAAVTSAATKDAAPVSASAGAMNFAATAPSQTLLMPPNPSKS